MKNNSMLKTLVPATHTMILCFLLASGVSALAQSSNGEPGSRRCSNRTLSGDYACSIQGFLLNAPVPGAPPQATFVGVTMNHYDGQGNASWLEHVVFNGSPFNQGWAPASGTYTVNPDCTGTAVVTTPNSPVPLNLYFVIADNGKELREVLNTDALLTLCKRVN
jgi:hypothetical protein